MRISESFIQMEAASNSARWQHSVEQLRVWGNPQQTNEEAKPWVFVDLSDKGKQLAEKIQETNAIEPSQFELPEEDRNKLKLLSDFIYVLTGKRIKFVIPKEINQLKKLQSAGYHPQSKPVARRMQGFGISYHYSETIIEQESMSFKTEGIVKTQDGREIKLNLNLSMSRSFASSTSITFKAGDALVDPLVINLKGSGASLGSKNYEFDLNNDGIMDKIAFTNSGSGFLALDKNGNGVVDDGSELFGPSLGNGFMELAAYDEDNNGWIDENDAVYQNLSIWIREDDGEPKLLAIGEVGVGAIYLGHVETPFTLKDNTNNTLGQIRQSGIFLFENGSAGTIQHVDLSI